MPQHKQPKTLVSLCHTALACELVSLCRMLQNLAQETSPTHALSIAHARLRPLWITSLPGHIRSQLLQEGAALLGTPVPDTGTMGAGPVPLYLLSLLLAPDIYKLRVELCCYYGCSHQAALLKLLAVQGKGLESLQLARSALLRLDQTLLQSALTSATSLRQLILHNIANDATLGVIGKSCKNLTHLDVAHSRQVTDAGLRQLLLRVEIRDKVTSSGKYAHSLVNRMRLTSWSKLKRMFRPLTRLVVSQQNDKMDDMPFLLEYCESGNDLCSTLRVLNIANTGVTSTGVLLALKSAPELESLGEYCHMGRALEVIENASKPIIEVPSFSLRIARSSRTSQHRLELLARACPNLHRLSLSEPHHSPENLSLLPTSLTSLNLHGVPNSSSWISKLYKFLEGPHGKNLRELTIRFFLPEFLTPLNLGSILQCCTNLQTFVLDGAFVDWKLDSLLYLPLLEKIQLGKLVASEAVKNLMLSAPNLKTVHLHSCIDLEDQDLIKLCNPNLECFYIYEASCVSINTVNALLANCPNLQRLGNLNNWGLTCNAIYSVINKIRDHNYNLEFNAGSHWFCSQCFSLNVHNI